MIHFLLPAPSYLSAKPALVKKSGGSRLVEMRPNLESRSLSDSGSLHLGVPQQEGPLWPKAFSASNQSLHMIKNAYLSESEECLGRERTGFDEL
jgi:hypothetical protein